MGSHGIHGIFRNSKFINTTYFLEVDFNSNVIYEFPGINLCNIKLILAENNNGLEKFDLQYSTQRDQNFGGSGLDGSCFCICQKIHFAKPSDLL